MPRRKSTHVDDPVAVGRRLREAREAAGLTQRDLAFAGCSPAYISRIESGDRIPSLQLLRELGRRLGVSEDYLATGHDTPPRAENRLLEGEVALRLDDVEYAEQLYREVLDEAGGPQERASALAGLGQAAFRRGDPRAAIEYLREALAVWRAEPADRPALADTLGRALAMVGDLSGAVELFRSCLEAAKANENSVEEVRFAVLLANTLIDRGEFEPASELLGEIVQRAEVDRDPLLRARLYWSQSRLYAMQNDAAAAARYARKALGIVELTEHDWYTARAYELLAAIELDRQHAEEALELLRKAWPLLEKSGNPLERAGLRLEEARALAQLGRREEAAALAMEVSGLLAEANPNQAGRSYALLGDIYAAIGEQARAREVYELAVELLERNPNRFLVSTLGRLAELLESEGETEQALAVLKRAVEARAGAE